MSIYDVTSKEILIGNLMRLLKLKEFYRLIHLYKKRFKKPLNVIFNNKFKQYPFVVELSDNKMQTLRNFGELLSILYQFDYDSQHDTITLKNKGLNTKLKGSISNGEVVGIF